MNQPSLETPFFNNKQEESQFNSEEIPIPIHNINQPQMQFQEQTNKQNQNQVNDISQLNPNQNNNININMDFNQNDVDNNLNNNTISLINNNINNNNDNDNNTYNKKNNDTQNENNRTKLENKFSFWYRISDDIIQYQAPKQALDKKIYETQVKKIHEFDTVEEFWGIFQHLRKPDSCKPGIEFMMFKEPIKPMWEDEYNKNGGKISIKLKKDYTTIIWEEMIFALIGGILPKEMKEEINGIVVTSRKEFNTLQIWFKTFEDKIKNDLEQCIRDLLVIPDEVNLEIKQFNKKENNNEKKTGGYYNNKGYNYNYYYDDGYNKYREDKNQYKKNKHHY